MEEALKALDGFYALASGVRFPWNTPFRTVREGLEGQDIRQIEEQGLRMIRFEETLPGSETGESVDLQNELHFNPDYGYGLRSGSVRIEGIGSRSHLKLEGSYRPLVMAYFRIYHLMKERFGAPQLTSHLKVDDPESIVKVLDHSRDALHVSAVWLGPKTELHHDLHVSFAPRHVLHISPVSSRLVLRNETGRDGIRVEIEFEGGHSEAGLPGGGERVVEVPPEGEVRVRVKVGSKSAESRIPIRGSRSTVRIGRRWFGGAPRIDVK